MKNRHLLLLQSGIILFAIWYAYDIPAALNRSMGLGNTENNTTSITSLYSAYACPNIIVPLFFSFLTKYSKFKLAIALVFTVFVGQVIFTRGLHTQSLSTMLLGRIIFGIGGESFSIIQNRILIDHFRGKELAFAMGIFNSSGRLGTVFNFFITPIIAAYVGSLASALVSIVILVFALLLSIRIGFNAENKLRVLNPVNSMKKDSLECPVSKGSQSESILSVLIENSNPNRALVPDYGNNSDQSSMLAWEEQKKDPAYLLYFEKAREERMRLVEDSEEGEEISSSFKLLVTISFLFGMVWAPFYNIAPMMFQQKYGVSIIESSHMLGFVEFVSISLVLIIGPIADKYGYKLLCMTLGCITLGCAHASIMTMFFKPYTNILLLGIAAPLIACYWPCVPKLVSDQYLATGFAVIYCALNFAFTVSPMIVAYLVFRDKTYTMVESYILTVIIFAFCFILLLSYQNWKKRLGLNDKENLAFNNSPF